MKRRRYVPMRVQVSDQHYEVHPQGSVKSARVYRVTTTVTTRPATLDERLRGMARVPVRHRTLRRVRDPKLAKAIVDAALKAERPKSAEEATA